MLNKLHLGTGLFLATVLLPNLIVQFSDMDLNLPAAGNSPLMLDLLMFSEARKWPN